MWLEGISVANLVCNIDESISWAIRQLWIWIMHKTLNLRAICRQELCDELARRKEVFRLWGAHMHVDEQADQSSADSIKQKGKLQKSMFEKIEIMRASAKFHLPRDFIYSYLWGHQSHCLLMAEICAFMTKDLSMETLFRETIHCCGSIGHIKAWSTKARRIILRLPLVFVVKEPGKCQKAKQISLPWAWVNSQRDQKVSLIFCISVSSLWPLFQGKQLIAWYFLAVFGRDVLVLV